jgi:hypothetical protein
VAAVAALAFNAAFAPFHARLWLGETVDVGVTDLKKREAGDETHFDVSMRTAGGVALSDEASHTDFVRLRGVQRIKARHVPSWPSASTLGPDVTVHSAAFVAVPLLGALALAYVLRAHSSRPWYDKKLVEQGSGKLPDSELAAQKPSKRPEGRRRETSSG